MQSGFALIFLFIFFITLSVFALFIFLYSLLICVLGTARIWLPRKVEVWQDDERLVAEEQSYLPTLPELEQQQFLRAKQWQDTHPVNLHAHEISVDDFWYIQQHGVSAWNFAPQPGVGVIGNTELNFVGSDPHSVQTNLPLPSTKDIYYFELKLYDLAEGTTMAMGLATKPYPSFRLPGYHKYSVCYESTGHSRINSSFVKKELGHPWQRGDVIGCGFETRRGAIFFTHNGKRVGEVVTGMRLNLFPTIGSQGDSQVYVNLGQAGYVFIQANVKDWGFAAKEGSLEPPPTYLEAPGTILLDVWHNEEVPPYQSIESNENDD